MERAERAGGAGRDRGSLAIVGGLVLVLLVWAAAAPRLLRSAPGAGAPDPRAAAAARLAERANLLYGLRARVDLIQRALFADLRARAVGEPGAALEPAIEQARSALGAAHEACAHSADATAALEPVVEGLEAYVDAARRGALARPATSDAARASAEVVFADELRCKLVAAIMSLSDEAYWRSVLVESGE
jgi:hypothetical protein